MLHAFSKICDRPNFVLKLGCRNVTKNVLGLWNPVTSLTLCPYKIEPVDWNTKANATARIIVNTPPLLP